MADFTDRVKLIIDVVGDKAAGDVKKISTEVGQAEGAFGKLKAAAGGLGSALGPALAPAAIAAGIGTAVKVVGDLVSGFTDLALAAGDTAAKMGTSVDEASRWTEVAGDLGVNVDDVATAANRLNKEAGQGKLLQYGIDADNANDRLVQTLEYLASIPDEAERARVGAELLGKGWTSVAPLVDQAGQLRDRLGEVSDAKIINPDELARARALRDAFDGLRDTLDDVKLAAGEALQPLVSAGTQIITPFVGLLDKAANAFANLADAAGGSGDGMKKTVDGIAGGIPIFGAAYNVAKQLTGGFDDAGGAAAQLAEAQKAVNAEAVRTAAAQAQLGDVIDVNGQKYLVLAAGVRNVTDLTAEQVGPLQDAARAAGDKATADTTEADAAKEATKAAGDKAKALDAEIKAEQDAAKAISDANDARRAAADATIALSQANDDLADFVAGSNKQIQEAQGDQSKLNDINREAVRKAGDVADAVNRIADEQAAANGTTQTAAGRLDAWNGSMLTTAANLQGPMRGAVIAYVAQVNEIPPEKTTEIQAAIDRGELAEANRLLTEASAARTADINADAHTADAQKKLDELERNRYMNLYVRTYGWPTDPGPSFGSSSAMVGRAAAPSGGNGSSRARGASGDPGLPRSDVVSVPVAGGGPRVYVTYNAPPGTAPDDVVGALRRWESTVGTVAQGATGL